MEGAKRESIRALRKGIDLGMTHIDTAEMYGAGAVETIVGEALLGLREKVFLVSKVLPSNATYQGTLEACHQSLKRLRTDYLDVYLLHWPSDEPLEETFRAFAQLEKEGKIRHFGVSNFDASLVSEALKLAGDRVACDQVLYHLKERAIEEKLVPLCTEKNVPIVAYSPFGQQGFPDDHKTLKEIAKRHGATPRQVGLQFLVKKGNCFVIPKASREAHVSDNAGALSFSLTSEDLRAVDESFPMVPKKRLPVI